MKVFQQPAYTTICGTPDEWPEMKKQFPAEAKVSVIDLRAATEMAGTPLEKMPDGWLFRALPVRGETVSEQDIDVFRREQRRHGKLVVVSSQEARGVLLVLTDLARLERTDLAEDDLKGLSGLEQEGLLREWLARYLERHRSTALAVTE